MTPDRLPRHWTLACACALVLIGLVPAVAQFLPGPGQSSPPGQFPPASGQSAFPPPPGQSAFPPPPGQGGPQSGPPPGAFPAPANNICQQFPPIRQAAEQGAAALRSAGERKAQREEVCGLFKSFVVKEARLIKFLVDHKTACNVPEQAIAGAKANHVKTQQLTKTICSGGGGGGAAPGPTLSDALGGPIIADDTSAKQPGTGTFNTLTGNVLSR
jgi:hypothetical protein